MIELTDAKMVDELSRILQFPLDRIIYGQLTTAKTYWMQYRKSNSTKDNVIEELPYMAFYRTIKFHEQNKKSSSLEVTGFDDKTSMRHFCQCMLNYTVEVMTAKVTQQNSIMKRYILWATTEDCIQFKDDAGVDWSFRVIPDDPEDNSDLEMEEDYGRIIRTTLNIQVEGLLMETGSDDIVPILDILAKIHLYYDDKEEAIEATNIQITGN
jgi:hypothetical protein